MALQVMDLTSLKAVLTDLRKIILPSRFEKAQQPEPGTLQLGLRTLHGLYWIEMSWRADAPRLVQIPPPSKFGEESTLAQQFQSVLRQKALVEIKQTGFDRVVEFGLTTRPGEPIEKTLVLELMGRHSNLLLLDQARKVITLGRQVRRHESRVRPISTGDSYVSPPPLTGIPPSSKESFHRWKKRLCLLPVSLKNSLQQSYQGISPSLALQLAHEEAEEAQKVLALSVLELSEEYWHSVYKRWCLWLINLEGESLSLCFKGPTQYRLWGEEITTSDSIKRVSLSLGNYYRNCLEEKSFNQNIKELQKQINQTKEGEKASLLQQENLLENSLNSHFFQTKADEILCLPSPSKELINKALKLYQKAKKLRRSSSLINERISHHQQRLNVIEESEVFLEELLNNNWEDQSHRLQRLFELRQEFDEFAKPDKKGKKKIISKKRQFLKPLELTSPRGLVIQIGRNHKQNEWISLRQARSGDLWFHAQECPGSHVVLKSSNGLAQEEDLQMATNLAAFFSRAKGNKKVPVVMVPTDQLQRIRGAHPGTLRHRKSNVRWAEPSKAIEHVCP